MMSKEKISILIIDDEEMIVDEFLFFLEQFGYDVKGLTDSKIAVEKLKKEKFDIVITDLKMPEVSGMDIAKTVKKYSPETLTFIITGFATVDSVIEAIQQGVYDYIRKPFKFKEIKIGIERAVEQILLKRENKMLNEKIQQMLSYITTLYDISSILYQITDFSMVQEMIIDTITEGLNIPKSAIFIKQGKTDKFKIEKYHGLDQQFIDACVFSSISVINDKEISKTQSTIFENINDYIILDDKEIKIKPDINYFILTPIKFQNSVMGYLSIFTHSENSLPLEDEQKLLNIIATQAAPIFQKKFSVKQSDNKNIKKLQPFTENTLDQYILEAKKINSTVSFVQCRLENNVPDYEIKNIQEIQDIINKIVTVDTEEKIIVLWQNYDSLILIIPNSNPATSEILISNIKTKFEQKLTLEDDTPAFSMDYAICSYPYDQGNGEKLLKQLNKKIFFNPKDVED